MRGIRDEEEERDSGTASSGPDKLVVQVMCSEQRQYTYHHCPLHYLCLGLPESETRRLMGVFGLGPVGWPVSTDHLLCRVGEGEGERGRNSPNRPVEDGM